MIVGGLDIETTSKLDPAHRIIEVCIQRWHYHPDREHTHALIDTNTWRINPERSIDPKAFAVHGIALDDLAGCPNFETLAPQIMGVFDSCDYVVAHNGDEFDRPFMRMELERVKYPLSSIDKSVWFDTMLQSRWANTWGKVPSLRELCWACDVEYDPAKAHAAEYDVRKMMECFFFGARGGFFQL